MARQGPPAKYRGTGLFFQCVEYELEKKLHLKSAHRIAHQINESTFDGEGTSVAAPHVPKAGKGGLTGYSTLKVHLFSDSR